MSHLVWADISEDEEDEVGPTGEAVTEDHVSDADDRIETKLDVLEQGERQLVQIHQRLVRTELHVRKLEHRVDQHQQQLSYQQQQQHRYRYQGPSSRYPDAGWRDLGGYAEPGSGRNRKENERKKKQKAKRLERQP